MTGLEFHPSTTQYCTTQYCTTQYCTTQYCTTQYCTTQYCTTQYCTTQYCTTIYYSSKSTPHNSHSCQRAWCGEYQMRTDESVTMNLCKNGSHFTNSLLQYYMTVPYIMCWRYTGIGISLNNIHTQAHTLLIFIVCIVQYMLIYVCTYIRTYLGIEGQWVPLAVTEMWR